MIHKYSAAALILSKNIQLKRFNVLVTCNSTFNWLVNYRNLAIFTKISLNSKINQKVTFHFGLNV